MKYFEVDKKNNNKLILFFNGWAMNESAVKHITNDDFDVIMINDYRDFNFNFEKLNLKKYEQKNLICFSMGVYCANLFYDELKNFDTKIAINSTNKIIDNIFGIPEKVYKITHKFLNEENLKKFIDNMFNATNENFKKNLTISANIEDLKQELISIQNIKLDRELIFDRAIISNDDKIVPTKNQINFWQEYKKNVSDKIIIEEVNSSHYPFNLYKNWQELLCPTKN